METSSTALLAFVPFPHSYWVIPGRLLAGPYPGALRVESAEPRLSNLVDCGIRYVINLMETNEVNHQGQAFVPYIETLNRFAARNGTKVRMKRYPIRDGSVPTPAIMKQILDDIDAQMASGCPVYVHCWGGKGRTGSVIGCFLVRHNLATHETVIQRLDHLRRNIRPYQIVPESEEQRAFVRAWAE
ncbi:MAG: protein phosphatase [Chloroflexi bacterium]|nr:MAG: protein phosphatase [Chloroflexota bacterium]